MIIGAGKRVAEAVLPALEAASDSFELTGILTRSRSVVRTSTREYGADKLENLDQDRIDDADLIYMAVSKPAVPAVAKRLARFDLSRTDLLIETPVMLFKHFWFVRILRNFRNVWVAEDCVELPYFDTLDDLSKNGPWDVADFHRSAYKYHGLAVLKRLFQSNRILLARVRDRNGNNPCRSISFSRNRRATILEPRDYSHGWFELSGSGVTVTDRKGKNEDQALISPIVEKGRCRGFAVMDTACNLKDEETSLIGPIDPETSVTSMMDGMKRVGFYRMLRRISDRGDGYSMEEALDDMVIDYYLDKIGFFHPMMGVRSITGRLLLNAVTGAANRFAPR